MFCTIKYNQPFFALIEIDCSFAGCKNSLLARFGSNLIGWKTSEPCNVGNIHIRDWFATSQTESTKKNELSDGGGPTGARATIDLICRQTSAD